MDLRGPRRGFTLLEMLIATVIFLIGFVAVYGLFLAGVKFRRDAENTTRGAIAASSVLAEIRLHATRDDTLPAPTEYEGDGIAADGPEAGVFLAHPDQPGLFYRVDGPTDLQGDPGGTGSAIRFAIQTVYLGSPRGRLDEDEVARYLGGSGTVADYVQRGVIQELPAVIYRHYRP